MYDFFMDLENNFLCYKTSREDREIAEKRFQSKFSESNLLNSKTKSNKKESRMAGIVGELAFEKLYGKNSTYVGDGNVPYDFIINNNGKAITIDVKCKMRSVPPRKHFDASIYPYQQNGRFFENTDYYAFLSTIQDYSLVWFCGIISKERWKKSKDKKLWNVGDVDETNGKIFTDATWSMPYGKLTQFEAGVK